jgi:hypothetical protein
MLPALVARRHFASFLGLDGPEELEPHADDLLALASDVVREELGQRIDRVDDDVAELEGKGTATLLLPEVPVLEVTGVEVDGAELDPDGYRLRRGDQGRLAMLVRAGSWPRHRPVIVTYSHGYRLHDDDDLELEEGEELDGGEVPGTIRLVIMRAAARAYFNPTEARQESVGRYSHTVATPTVALSDFDRATLGPAYPGTGGGRR